MDFHRFKFLQTFLFVSVTSGVPQGSVLGPTLFLFYINDIANELDSTVRLFADDTMVYLVIKSQSDAKKLQKDLNCLGSWEKEWRMELHPDKCSVLSITRSKTSIHYEYQLHGQPLEHVKSAKYLGVTIQSDLKWTTHVNTVTNKANRTLKKYTQWSLHPHVLLKRLQKVLFLSKDCYRLECTPRACCFI